MDNINLLDCTLRDGGYINDWKFGKSAIKDISNTMVQTGVEIFEVGFLKDEPYHEDRVVFNSMEQVKRVIAPKQKNVEYAVMCEVVNPIPLEKLAYRDEQSADIIRVIVWKNKIVDGTKKDALEDGYQYCKGIVERGYKLCVQPARVDQYTDEEFASMVQKFSKLNPMAIYVVDSWGTQNAEELLHYMHIADNAMPESIALGYHGHNNMMQALSVAQAMLKEGFNRNLMIDASVYGIGRGAGNLNIEIISKYLNEHYGKQYLITPMLELFDKYINDIYQKEKWGFSVPYYLTAKYNCNPAYAREFVKLPANELEEYLRSMSQEDRVIFNSDKAKRLFFNYKKKH